MPALFSHRKRQNLAIIALGAVLVGYIAFLLIANYRSQMELQKSGLEQMRLDAEKQAGAVSYFFSAQKNDFKDLTEKRELAAFFENKALGMSMEYGLQDSLFGVAKVFDRFLENRRIGGDRIFTRIVFLESHGAVLVDRPADNANPANEQNWQRFLAPENPAPQIIVERQGPSWQIMISTPYFFKGAFSGQIIAWISCETFYHHIVKAAGGASQRLVNIVTAKAELLCPPAGAGAGSKVEIWGAHDFQDLCASATGEVHRFESSRENGSKVDLIAIRVPIPDTPFFLVAVAPAAAVFGRTSPSHLLAVLAILSLAILGGVAIMVRGNTRNLVLQARLEEAAESRQAVEDKNRQLEQEIRERRLAEQAWQQSEEKYRLLVSQIPAMVFRGYGDWSIDPLDEKVETLTGYSKEDFESRRVKWRDLIPAEDLDYAAEVFIEALKTDKSYVREHRLRKKDGEIIWVQCRGQISCDDQGKVDHISGVSFDVTARRQAEETRRESEKRFSDIAENASEWIWEVDAAGKYTYASPVVEQLLGYAPQEILEKHFYDLFAAEDREELKNAAFATFAGKQPFREFLNRNLRKDGKVVWLLTSGVPILDDQGNLLGYRGADIDVTARRQAEEALKESERFLADIFASIQDGVNILDLDYNILRVNPAVERWYAHALPLAGKKCYEAFHGRGEPCEICPYRQTLETGKATHKVTPREGKDGSEAGWIEVFTFPITDIATGKVKGVVLYVRDITERKQAEEALLESETKYRLLAENVIDVIWTVDLNWKVTYASPSCESLTGYSDDEIVGMTLDQLLTPGSMDLCNKTLAELLSPENLARQEYPNFFLPQLELRFKDGSRSVYIEIKGSFLKDYQGQPIGMMGVARDITERKQLEEQFLQAQKMEAVGRLAGGVAHDFNNILTAITGYGELLLMNPDIQDPVSRDVKDILQAADRAASLTRQLLAFSRKQVLQPQRLDLNQVVANLDKMLRRIIGEDIDLVTVLGHDLGAVQADPGQIEQVVMNLAVNARDAMPQGGKLTIETADADLDTAYAQNHLESQPGPYVMLAVSDNGVGLDQEAQARIFEPFFTTKELGKGTGLGLSTVYGIVKQSGGFIYVYSNPGEGTTFKIYLPRLEAAADLAGLGKVPDRCEWGSETILLVEDEDLVRQVASRILVRHGYTVLEAASGRDALLVSREHAGPIHLMLTDVVMPGMSGWETAKSLKLQRPEMKVLFMSGYTENAIVHHGVLDPGVAFIQKPFRYSILAQKIREILDASQDR